MKKTPDIQIDSKELVPGTEILTKTPWHQGIEEEKTLLRVVAGQEGPDEISFEIHEQTGEVVGPMIASKENFLTRLHERGIQNKYWNTDALPDRERIRLMVEATRRFATGQPLTEDSTLAHVLERIAKS